MSRYEAFLPEVLPYVPECPEIVAVNAIRNAVIEFCDKSLWLVYEHDPITIYANNGVYELDLPNETISARILDGWVNNLPVVPRGEDEIKRLYPFNWREIEGRPMSVTQLDPTEVIFVPRPTDSDVYTAQLLVALKPTRSSLNCDDSLFERWAEKIGFGARARLHELPGQTFSDPNLALRYRALFNQAIGEAKIERNRGLTRAAMRVRPPKAV